MRTRGSVQRVPEDRLEKNTGSKPELRELFQTDAGHLLGSQSGANPLDKLLTHSVMCLHFCPEILAGMKINVKKPIRNWINELNREIVNTGYVIVAPPGFNESVQEQLAARIEWH